MRYRTIMLAVSMAAGVLLSGAIPQGQAAGKPDKSEAPKPQRSEALKPGKPAAPVEIVGSIQSSNASLTITFKMAGEDVAVRVYGTDGLVVSGNETRITNGSFKAGQTLKLDAAYTPPPGQSNLAVVVSGQFGGNRRSRVVSFTVGDKRLPSQPRSDITVNEKGKTIIVLPAEQK